MSSRTGGRTRTPRHSRLRVAGADDDLDSRREVDCARGRVGAGRGRCGLRESAGAERPLIAMRCDGSKLSVRRRIARAGQYNMRVQAMHCRKGDCPRSCARPSSILGRARALEVILAALGDITASGSPELAEVERRDHAARPLAAIAGVVTHVAASGMPSRSRSLGSPRIRAFIRDSRCPSWTRSLAICSSSVQSRRASDARPRRPRWHASRSRAPADRAARRDGRAGPDD